MHLSGNNDTNSAVNPDLYILDFILKSGGGHFLSLSYPHNQHILFVKRFYP